MDDVVRLIAAHTAKYGFPPTQREIAEKMGVTERAVRKRLDKLRDAGEVTWEPGKRRTLQRANMKAKSIPMS